MSQVVVPTDEVSPKETILFGTTANIYDTFVRMGLLREKEKDMPGWMDNLAKALTLPETGYYLRDPGQEFMAFKRWEEYGDDFSFANLIGDYINGFLRLIGAAYNSYKDSSKPPIIEEINEQCKEKYLQGYQNIIADYNLELQHQRQMELYEAQRELEEQIKLSREGAEPRRLESEMPLIVNKIDGISGKISDFQKDYIDLSKGQQKTINNLVKKIEGFHKNYVTSSEKTRDNLFGIIDNFKGSYEGLYDRFIDYAILAEQHKANEIVRSNTLQNLNLNHDTRIRDVINYHLNQNKGGKKNDSN